MLLDHSIVDVVPKLGPSKKQRRKKEETEEKTEGQNAEEESVITKPDKSEPKVFSGCLLFLAKHLLIRLF